MVPTAAAAVQTGTVLFDTPRTVTKLEDLAADAANQLIALDRRVERVMVFPEAFVGGYPKGHDFGARVGSRTPEGRDWFQRYWSAAIDVPGPETERIAETARRVGATLVVGVIERAALDEGRGTLYCTALIVAPDGRLVGRHRKVMPTVMERIIWGFGDGSTLDVADTPAGRVGAVICWENYMPLLRTAMYAQGVEIYAAPTVDDRDSWATSMRMIAMEGRCFVVSSVQHLQRADAPDDYGVDEGADAATALIRGGSTIVSPLGEVLAAPVYDQDAVLTAVLDPSLIAQGKYEFDVVGHYARPDLFSLSVNTAAQRPVTFSQPFTAALGDDEVEP